MRTWYNIKLYQSEDGGGEGGELSKFIKADYKVSHNGITEP